MPGTPADPSPRDEARRAAPGHGGPAFPSAPEGGPRRGDRREPRGVSFPPGGGAAGLRRGRVPVDARPPGRAQRPFCAFLPPVPRRRRILPAVRRRRPPPERRAFRASGARRDGTADPGRLHPRGSLGVLSLRPFAPGVRGNDVDLLRIFPGPPGEDRGNAPPERGDLDPLPAPGPSRLRAGGAPPAPAARGKGPGRRRDAHLLEEDAAKGGGAVFPLPRDRIRAGGGGAGLRGGGGPCGGGGVPRGRGDGRVPPGVRVRPPAGVPVPGTRASPRVVPRLLLAEVRLLPGSGRPDPFLPGGGCRVFPRASAGAVAAPRRLPVPSHRQRDPPGGPAVDGGPERRAAGDHVARVRAVRPGAPRSRVRLGPRGGGVLHAPAGAGERLAGASRPDGEGDARRGGVGDPQGTCRGRGSPLTCM